MRGRRTTASQVSAYSAYSAVSLQAVWFWLSQVRISGFQRFSIPAVCRLTEKEWDAMKER
jgi:hypothetical protein